MALVQDIQSAYQPFTGGQFGFSPATQAATQAFIQNTLPVIQNQAQLQGLGSGPTIADITGRSLATALPQFIQSDLQNRLAAAQGLTGLGSQVVIPAWQQQQNQQAQALKGLQSAGELTRGISQDVFDAQREEMLRLQGLSESGTFGAFGTLSPLSKTETSQSGGK